MWDLVLLTGYCMGLWCTVSTTPGFETWEACDRERAAIVATQLVPDDTVVIAQCEPNHDTGEKK